MQERANSNQLKVEAQQVGFFETPIAYCQLKDGAALMAELRSAILKNRTDTEGLSRSNIGGWHSNTDMMRWGGEAAITLADTAIGIAKRMSYFQESSPENYDWVVRMWANVNEKGGLNQLHAHPGNLWAAVLYLDMGDGPDSDVDVGGAFYIEDPRFPMSAMHNTAIRLLGSDGNPQQYEVEFKLAKGKLVVFPAWLRHGVRPYMGDRERISIAMNIDARRKPV